MKRIILVFSLFVFSFFPTFLSAYSESARTDSAHQTRELFSEWDNPNTPGCSVAVIQDGAFVFKESFGMADLEHGVPLQPDSMFYACSVSKQFVAMCVLLLEEEGKLALNDDVRQFLPEFPDYGNPVTIRHLLHHTSGIRDYFSLWEMAGYDFQDYMPSNAVYELICRQKNLNFKPGEAHLYSNSCYFLLYKIIEKVSGKTLREYAAENIFKPLGMQHSFFHDDYSRIIPDRAMGYYPSEKHGFVNMISRFDLVGSGGMFTCVEDFLPWDSNFHENRLGLKDPGLIKKMITTGKLNNGEDSGYALALVPGTYCGLEIIEHSGSLGGYRTHYLRFPEQRFSVVILSNISSCDPKRKTREIADIYLENELEPGKDSPREKENIGQNDAESRDPKKPAPVPLTHAEQERYSGNFYSEELDCTYSLQAEAASINVRIRWNPTKTLELKEDGIFEGPFLKIRFFEPENGESTGFYADSGGTRNIRFVKQ